MWHVEEYRTLPLDSLLLDIAPNESFNTYQTNHVIKIHRLTVTNELYSHYQSLYLQFSGFMWLAASSWETEHRFQ